MTRGTIFYFGQNTYETCEFNGDMYPDGCAEDLIKAFKRGELTTAKAFEGFIIRFNRNHYNYEASALLTPWVKDSIAINRIMKCSSDYIYIINETESTIVVDGEIVDPHSLGIKCGEIEQVQRPSIDAKELYKKILKRNIYCDLKDAHDNEDCILTYDEILEILGEVKKKIEKDMSVL